MSIKESSSIKGNFKIILVNGKQLLVKEGQTFKIEGRLGDKRTGIILYDSISGPQKKEIEIENIREEKKRKVISFYKKRRTTNRKTKGDRPIITVGKISREVK